MHVIVACSCKVGEALAVGLCRRFVGDRLFFFVWLRPSRPKCCSCQLRISVIYRVLFLQIFYLILFLKLVTKQDDLFWVLEVTILLWSIRCSKNSHLSPINFNRTNLTLYKTERFICQNSSRRNTCL